MFHASLFVLLSFFFWPLYCLTFWPLYCLTFWPLYCLTFWPLYCLTFWPLYCLTFPIDCLWLPPLASSSFSQISYSNLSSDIVSFLSAFNWIMTVKYRLYVRNRFIMVLFKTIKHMIFILMIKTTMFTVIHCNYLNRKIEQRYSNQHSIPI